VDRLAFVTPFERREADSVHQSGTLQFVSALDVDPTPMAARPSGAEADRVAVGGEILADAVHPAETQRFVERCLVSDAALARGYLEETEHELVFRIMLLEPGAKLFR